MIVECGMWKEVYIWFSLCIELELLAEQIKTLRCYNEKTDTVARN